MVNVRKATKSSPIVLIIILLIGALSFAAALAFNSLIQALIRRYAPSNDDEVKQNLIYVGIVTVLLIVFAYLVYLFYPEVSSLI